MIARGGTMDPAVMSNRPFCRQPQTEQTEFQADVAPATQESKILVILCRKASDSH